MRGASEVEGRANTLPVSAPMVALGEVEGVNCCIVYMCCLSKKYSVLASWRAERENLLACNDMLIINVSSRHIETLHSK